MHFQLVDSGWGNLLDKALRADHGELSVVCPFIKAGAAKRLLGAGIPKDLRVITRFKLCDFCAGVSDTAALRILLAKGAKIRGVRGLHAKLYIFGSTSVIATSANLTEAGLMRNLEFGFEAKESVIVSHCRKYFGDLWKRAGPDLTTAKLDAWESQLRKVRALARPSVVVTLPDEGANVGALSTPLMVSPQFFDAPQAFVKFFGESTNRERVDLPVIEEVKRAGCHWSCTYPRGKRPRQVQEGAVLFMGRLVKEPNDILIFGRAIGMEYEKGRDDATASDISLRAWREKWPHYIRVHHAQFIAGVLGNGVRLSELMDELEENSFDTTQRHAANGTGSTNPRGAYRQQPAVRLSSIGYEWLNQKLEEAFQTDGKIPEAEMEQLDWPETPP
jgi:hypothetical protein